MPKYWPGTTTIVSDIPASSYTGQLPPARTSGRKAGSLNVTTRTAKDCLQECFRLAGGVEAMVKWAKESPSEFFPLYIRALVPKPLDVSSEDSQVTIIISPPTVPATPQAQTLSLDPPKQNPVDWTP